VAVLTGSVVGLALIAQALAFGGTFVTAAVLFLAVDLVVGLGTLARLNTINNEDIRLVAGMNRIRRAYFDLDPGVEEYFITHGADDWTGVQMTLGFAPGPAGFSVRSIGHGFTTVPGMVTFIDAVLAGVLGTTIAAALRAETSFAIGVGAAVFVIALLVLGRWGYRAIRGLTQTLSPRFPSTPRRPPEDQTKA